MAYSPYQIAGSQASLLDLLQQSKFGKQKSRIASTSQRGKMTEEYEKELEEAQKKAEAKAKKNKGLFRGLRGLGMFLGPLGAGITGGLASAGQMRQQQKGARLLKDVDKKRFEKTFLRKPMKQYWEEAEEAQLSSGDVLRGGLTGGLQSYITSKVFGGDEGIIKNWRQGRQQAKEVLSAPQGYGAAMDIPGVGKTPTGIEGGAGVSLPSSQELAWRNMKMTPVSRTPGLDKVIEESAFGKGFKGGFDELQSAMMLPMLIQQMMEGDKY